MHTLERLRLAIITTAVLPLTGCLIIPVGMFTENPYSKEILEQLASPVADRNLVRQKLGVPAHTRENQRYWFYTNQRETVGIIGGTSGVVLTDDTWLLVEFDDHGKVVFAEAADFKKCTSTGICLEPGAIYTDPVKGPIHPHPPRASECAVYLYLEKLPWPLATGSVRYAVDGKQIGIVDSDSYLFLIHPQGTIQISAYDLEISTYCYGGTLLYVRAIKKADWSWKTGEDLAPVSTAEGERKIQTRHPSLHN